jgi:para-nitrobenzyl esterase
MALSLSAGTGSGSDLLVETRSGTLLGRTDKNDTLCWLGIPYAKPPVGELRWRAPVPLEPWVGIRKADRFGGSATQFQSIFTSQITGSEEALTLNVWRPRTGGTKLPVYVWIHGGGNSIGSSDPDGYHGYGIASRSEAVFVSLNYRLGPLGWFWHPAMASTQTGTEAGGNFGLLDILMALRWIQDNIEAFGGNPGNVILTGESAGAANTIALMISPLGRGLFHKAIIQSGYQRSVSMEEAGTQSEGVLLTLLQKKKRFRTPDQAREYRATMTDTEIMAFLRSCGDREILRCYTPNPTGMINHLYHIEDGVVFPAGGYDAAKKGIWGNPVPAILGSNLNETKMFLLFDRTKKPGTPLYETISDIGSLRFKALGVDEIAAGLTLAGVPAWGYRFDYGAPDEHGNSPFPGNYGIRLGAFHTLEIPFFLGTGSVNGDLFSSLIFNDGNRKSREILTDIIMTYTANFIIGGNPNTGRPVPLAWEAWGDNRESPGYLVFNMRGDEPDLRTGREHIPAAELPDRLKSRLSGSDYDEARRFLDM